MSIDRSGEWWRGSAAVDLDEYLGHHPAVRYPVNRCEHARCGCGDERFTVETDDLEDCARRTCVGCGAQTLVLDSAATWDEAAPEACVCPCGLAVFEVAVGFSHGDDGRVRWATIGLRCVACGTLGVYASWEPRQDPAGGLDRAG